MYQEVNMRGAAPLVFNRTVVMSQLSEQTAFQEGGNNYLDGGVKVFDNCERVLQHEFGSVTEFVLCWVKRFDVDRFTGVHESQRGVFFPRIESQVDHWEPMIDDGGFQL